MKLREPALRDQRTDAVGSRRLGDVMIQRNNEDSKPLAVALTRYGDFGSEGQGTARTAGGRRNPELT